MLKVFVIKSSTSGVPLAEIRTDMHTIDWTLDNTKGALPHSVGKDFTKLQAMLANSSHLSMEEPKQATAQLLTYILTNGDTIEITTDGKTAILNGKLLSEEEKAAIFNAIRTGAIKIDQKADMANPVPVLPTMHTPPSPKKLAQIDKNKLAELKAHNDEKARKEKMSGPDYDHSIEEADYRGTEDKNFAKDFMYRLKYGDKYGR